MYNAYLRNSIEVSNNSPKKYIPKRNSAKKAWKNHIVMLNKTFSNVLKKWDFEKQNINSFTLLRGREISALVGVFEHYELYTLQLSYVENK